MKTAWGGNRKSNIKRAEMVLITLKWETDPGITGYAVMRLLSYRWWKMLSIYAEEELFNFMIIIEIILVHLKVYDLYCSTEKFCFLEQVPHNSSNSIYET